MKGNKIQIQYKDELEVKLNKSSLLLYVIVDKCKLPSDIMGLYYLMIFRPQQRPKKWANIFYFSV